MASRKVQVARSTVESVDLERQLTNGKASCVLKVGHDPERHTLIVQLSSTPETMSLTASLQCVEVSQVEHRWYDRDFDCIEIFLGMHLENGGALYGYLLVTDQREVAFCTSSPATVV